MIPYRLNWLQFADDEKGSIAILTALLGTVLIGFAGLAIDVGYWQLMQRSMQGAADMAAYSAAIAFEAGSANSGTEAKGVTASMGFIEGQNGVTVTVNNPPLQGNHTGDATAWEVVVQKQLPIWFAKMFLGSAPIASSRAVAGPSSACHSDAGGDDAGGASGTNFVLSNNETVTLPDMNGKTMHVSGWGTVQFSHDANGATLILDSSCVTANTVSHDFNGSTFLDNYTPPNMNFVYVAHTLNGATFINGSEGSGGVFTIGHDSNGATFTFITCSSCSTSGSTGMTAVLE